LIGLEIGDLSLIVQIIIFFILILGLPLTREGAKNAKNLLRHGYLTTFALALHTILVVIIMIFLALDGYSDIFSLPIPSIVVDLGHIILGFAALIIGWIVVAFWFFKPLKTLGCYKVKKLMLPLIVIWALSLIMGTIVHLFNFF
jgi:K+-sensing histidine kinase KdpD